jgi:hypothetical protein
MIVGVRFMASFPQVLSVQVASTNALKSRKSFTYFTPDVFSRPCNVLIIKRFRKIVRVSFSAPNASQSCGAFLFVSHGRVGSARHKTQRADNQRLTYRLVLTPPIFERG